MQLMCISATHCMVFIVNSEWLCECICQIGYRCGQDWCKQQRKEVWMWSRPMCSGTVMKLLLDKWVAFTCLVNVFSYKFVIDLIYVWEKIYLSSLVCFYVVLFWWKVRFGQICEDCATGEYVFNSSNWTICCRWMELWVF